MGHVYQLKNEWNLDASIAKNTNVNDKAEKIGDMIKVSILNERNKQEARIEKDYFSSRKIPPHERVQPVLHFKERDIWDFIFKYKVPYCVLYKEGYRSLGAKGYTTKMPDIPAWEQDLENTYERAGRRQGKEEIMGKLRDLGYM